MHWENQSPVVLNVFLDVSSFLEAVLREEDGSYWHFPVEFLPLLEAGDPGDFPC